MLAVAEREVLRPALPRLSHTHAHQLTCLSNHSIGSSGCTPKKLYPSNRRSVPSIQYSLFSVTGIASYVARALRLSDDETAHFFNLARAAITTRGVTRVKRGPGQKVPDGLQSLIDSMTTSPAIVMNGSLDILAANALGRALYAPVFDRATGAPNLARFIFFDSFADQVFPQWKRMADEAVGLLQAEAARSPHSPGITQIVGELATRSEEFRTGWAAHNVTAHRHGTKQFRNPDFGELTLTYNVLARRRRGTGTIRGRLYRRAEFAFRTSATDPRQLER